MDIAFEGTLTKDELTKILKLAYRSHWIFLLARILILVMVLTVAVVYTFADRFNPLVLFGVVVMSLLTTYSFWAPILVKNNVAKGSQITQNAISGTIREDELAIQSAQSASTVQWGLYKYVKKNQGLIILYQNGSCFNFFPRSFFSSDGDWQQFQAWIDRQVADKHLLDLLGQPVFLWGYTIIRGALLYFLLAIFGLTTACFLLGFAIVLIDLLT